MSLVQVAARYRVELLRGTFVVDGDSYVAIRAAMASRDAYVEIAIDLHGEGPVTKALIAVDTIRAVLPIAQSEAARHEITPQASGFACTVIPFPTNARS